MSSMAAIEELDQQIDWVLGQPYSEPEIDELSEKIRDLAQIAVELRYVARAEFRIQLAMDLERHADAIRRGSDVSHARRDARISRAMRRTREEREFNMVPTFAALATASDQMRPATFVASFALHAVAIALLAVSGTWLVQRHREDTRLLVTNLVEPGVYPLPPAPEKAGGGGGGGDRDQLDASKGSVPRFAAEQITPPMVVLRNHDPKLMAEPTVVGPPDVTLPPSAQMGDPLSAILGPPSNGTGDRGGIGSGSGGGVGPGRGPGVGQGWGGGIGGGAFRVGGGVSAPRALYAPDPEYSEEARKAKYQGTVVLWLIVGADGRVHDVRVSRALGMGLDEKAVEAVRNWKFEPARMNGRPVAVQINVEVSFRLY